MASTGRNMQYSIIQSLNTPHVTQLCLTTNNFQVPLLVYCCAMNHHVMLYLGRWTKLPHTTLQSGQKFILFLGTFHEASKAKQDKRQNKQPQDIHKYVINNNSKVRTVAHPQFLCLRKVEATRSTGFNCEDVKAIFENLQELMSRHIITSSKIFNLNETGNSTVQICPDLSVLSEASKCRVW